MGVVAAIYFIRIAVGGIKRSNFTTTAGTDNKMNDVWFDVDNFRKVA
jgi:hypothetical protein